MSQNQNSKDSETQPVNQQQSLGDVQVQGDDNIFNVIQAEVVTLTQTKIIQISVDEIKTRELITASPYKGDDNFFNIIQGDAITLNQTRIIQVLADEIKTRKLITTSPYKGLRPFEPEDTTRFFGRDRFLAGLVNRLVAE